VNSLIVFAKEPIAGTVKTRLTPALAAEDAVLLYTAFVEDTCATIASLASRKKGDRCVLAAPGGAGPGLSAIAKRLGFETAAQEGPDLGARMAHAIGAEIARGAKTVLLVGSDSPTLPRRSLRLARTRLRSAPAAVLGPSTDGGYWMVGASGEVPDLFTDIPWSTREVLPATLARARTRNVTLSLVQFWYDVDEAWDVRFLESHIAQLGVRSAPRTAAALAALRSRNAGFFAG